MILTCPQCATRYTVDSAKLGNGGRLVRCSKCSHTWHQAPAAGAPQQVEPIPLDIKPRPIPPGSNLPAFPPRRKPRSQAAGWLVLVLVVVAVAAAGFLARERIVQLWPPAARLYGLAGVLQPVPGEGLELRNVSSKRTVENGVPLLIVEGQVANVSKEAKDVPPLRGALKDAKEHEVQQWTFSASEKKLLPGEVASFSTTLKNPVNEATGIAIGFAPAGKN